jgi:hypothetical protein
MARLEIPNELDISEFMSKDLKNRASPKSEAALRDITQGKGWESSRDASIFAQHGGITSDLWIVLQVSPSQGSKLLLSAKDPAAKDMTADKMGYDDIVRFHGSKIIVTWHQ